MFSTEWLGGLAFRVVSPATYPYGQTEFRDEMDIKERFWTNIRPGEVVLCIGASWGGYVLPALAQGAFVVAVEPASIATDNLARSVGANGWGERCWLVQGLLWNESPVPESFRASAVRNFGGKDDVLVRTLDELVEMLPQVTRLDRIHCDAEGAELPIMRSGLRTLDRFHPKLLIEDHTISEDAPNAHEIPHCVGIREELVPLLDEIGYVVESVPRTRGETGNPFLWAVPR